MPDNLFKRDIEALGLLAEAAEAVAKTSVDPGQVPGVTQVIVGLIGAEYLRQREAYLEADEPIPPTPTPRATYRGP